MRFQRHSRSADARLAEARHRTSSTAVMCPVVKLLGRSVSRRVRRTPTESRGETILFGRVESARRYGMCVCVRKRARVSFVSAEEYRFLGAPSMARRSQPPLPQLARLRRCTLVASRRVAFDARAAYATFFTRKIWRKNKGLVEASRVESSRAIERFCTATGCFSPALLCFFGFSHAVVFAPSAFFPSLCS